MNCLTSFYSLKCAKIKFLVSLKFIVSLSKMVTNIYTGWAKSQFTYVGLNSTVTECSYEIIISGMTYYHHWFEEFVK